MSQALLTPYQPLLDSWCDEVLQALTGQRQRRKTPQYDQKLGFWCGCQGYNPYYSIPFRKELVNIPAQSVQPLLDALQQKLEGEGIVPIRLAVGKDGYALRAVKEAQLAPCLAPDGQTFMVDALFALFL